jgi:hypothetical protein
MTKMGSTYGRFCSKFPQSRMKGERHRLSPLSLELLECLYQARKVSGHICALQISNLHLLRQYGISLYFILL